MCARKPAERCAIGRDPLVPDEMAGIIVLACRHSKGLDFDLIFYSPAHSMAPIIFSPI